MHPSNPPQIENDVMPTDPALTTVGSSQPDPERDNSRESARRTGRAGRTRWRRVLQPLLTIATALACVTVVAATLRRRPAIEPPDGVEHHYRATDFSAGVAQANSELAQLAAAASLDSAPQADNQVIARRLSLALVGSGLSLEELRALSLVKPEKQIRWWTTYLLEDDRWADYFAERLSRAYVGTDEGPFLVFRRRKFRMWLADHLREETPYDQIVKTMLSSEGLWTDTPQVNFVTSTLDDDQRCDPIRLAGRTSRAFLAQRIDCLQCHDDFLGELNFGTEEDSIDGVQQHFHELAAFFSGAALADPVFQGVRDDDREYKFMYLGEGEEEVVEPQVPFAQHLLPSEGKPRERLAEWVTHPENHAFSRATVNRIWALMFSRPLVAPVDNIPLDSSVPAVLDTLAEDFASHNFNLKRLIRMIVETDAFQRSSRAEFEVTPQHEATWAVFPLSQLRPEQVANSVFQAAKLTAIDSSSSIFTQLKSFGDLQSFLKRFGDRGEDEFDSEAVTIAQRLIMMNGNMVAERTKVDPVNNASTRISSLVKKNDQAIQLLFMATLNREPSESEMEIYLDHLHEKYGNTRSRALGDIHWALLNSTEFSWNH